MGLFSWLRKRRRRTVAPAPSPLRPAVLLPEEPVSTPNDFVVIDVGTTGLVPARDRIIEIAAVRTDLSGRVLDEWTTLINPGGPVGATKIHGITATDVRSAPRFADVLGDLNARLAGRALVAHNALFDLAFIRTEYARAGWTLPAAPYLCTLDASWTYLPHLSRRRLSDCCWASGIQLHDAHSALGDARATATLLAPYLAPKFGRPPKHEHVATPVLAAQVVWPAVPRYAFDVTLRQAGADVPMPAAPGTLWALLDNLPVTTVVDEGAPATATAYLELLFEVLEDGVLTDPEAQSLAEVAKVYALTRPQVEAAHRGFMLALAHKAVEDGKVTRNERNELFATAIALGFTDGIIRALLDEARAAMVEKSRQRLQAAARRLASRGARRIGEGVAFTGCDQLTRARLEGRAQAAGLRVTGSVSRKTAVLVTDGADPYTTKAISAREHGTRVVTPSVFADLVEHIQPDVQTTAKPPAVAPGQRSSVDQPAPSPTTRPTVEDPAVIRAWARQNGLSVGVRGRIPSDLLAAYRARDAEADSRA